MDEKVDGDARRDAIRCLASSRAISAYDFLICNVELELKVERGYLEIPGISKTLPCYYCLVYTRSGGLAADWNVAPAVLRNLDREVSSKGIERLADLMAWSAGDENNHGSYEHSVYLIEREMKKKNSDLKKDNLKIVLEQLKIIGGVK